MSAAMQSSQQVRPPLPSASSLTQRNVMERNKKVVFWFGVIEIILGLISCAIGIVTLEKDTSSRHDHRGEKAYYIIDYDIDYDFDIPVIEEKKQVNCGQGIWCGLFFVVYGVFGVSIRFKTTPCLYLFNLVMSVLGVIVMITLTVLSSISVSAANAGGDRFFAWYVILTVIGISGTLVSIMHAVFSNVRKSGRRNPEGRVMYTAVPQQSMIPVQMPNGQVLYYPQQPFYPMPMTSINSQYSMVPMPNHSQIVLPTHLNCNPTGSIPHSFSVPTPSTPAAGNYLNSHPGQVVPPSVAQPGETPMLQPSQSNPSTDAFSDRPPSYSEFDYKDQ